MKYPKHKKTLEITTRYCGLDKWDLLGFPGSQSGVIIYKLEEEGWVVLKIYPFRLSKWRLWNWARLTWIKLKVYFNLI